MKNINELQIGNAVAYPPLQIGAARVKELKGDRVILHGWAEPLPIDEIGAWIIGPSFLKSTPIVERFNGQLWDPNTGYAVSNSRFRHVHHLQNHYQEITGK